MQYFEKILATVSRGCEYNYGVNGATGFLYDSMKDRLRWTKLSVKHYIALISQIGQILSMSKEDYSKAKVKATKMSGTEIAKALIAAFGDGK